MIIRPQHKPEYIYDVPRTCKMRGEIGNEMSQWGDRYIKNGEKKKVENGGKFKKQNDWLLFLAARFPGPAHSFHHMVVWNLLTPSKSFCFKKHIL